MKDFTGKKWCEITDDEREELLELARPINGINGAKAELGECILDFLGYNFSIKGLLMSDEIIIDDDAVFYNPIG